MIHIFSFSILVSYIMLYPFTVSSNLKNTPFFRILNIPL